MLRYLFVLAAAVAIGNANAQVYKCKSSDGKMQFSDTTWSCKGGIPAEFVPERTSIDPRETAAAQQRAQRMQNEVTALDNEKVNAQAEYQAQQQKRVQAEAERNAVVASTASYDTEAVSNCVKDVERRGASQNVKAEMIAACRTAGIAQRSTGMSSEAVSTCVKNVERTGASEKEKARQLAACHGGDVQPEIEHKVAKKDEFQHPAVIKSCLNGTCRDQFGNDYKKDIMGNLEARDGRRCRQYGKTLECK